MDRDCAKIIQHLNRIQGQIDALKGYVENERSCEDVAHLTKSITTSFASVRAQIIEEMITTEFDSALTRPRLERLQTILSLYKA